jgi:hypothetical protein
MRDAGEPINIDLRLSVITSVTINYSFCAAPKLCEFELFACHMPNVAGLRAEIAFINKDLQARHSSPGRGRAPGPSYLETSSTRANRVDPPFRPVPPLPGRG